MSATAFDRKSAERAIARVRAKEPLTDDDYAALEVADPVLVRILKAASAADGDAAGPPDIVPATYHKGRASLGTVNMIAKAIIRFTNETSQRLMAMALRVADLEARPAAGVAWFGTHEPGRAYPAAALTTRQGSLWLSKTLTSATPGQSEDWTLIVKNGSYREGA